MVITEQVGSTEVQFIIPRKDRLMLRHLPQAQEEEIQYLCSTQISCKSNSTWTILHTEILDMLFSTASHLMPIAPQLYLTARAALGQRDPFIPHMTDLLCTCYIAALVLLGVEHFGQKQTSGHPDRCDGLGKERKRLGWVWRDLGHLFDFCCVQEKGLCSVLVKKQNVPTKHQTPSSVWTTWADFLTGHLCKNVAKIKN